MWKGKKADNRVCALWTQSGGPALKEMDVGGGRVESGQEVGGTVNKNTVYMKMPELDNISHTN